MRSEQSIWSAYNLVLPALPPYDDDGLSLALKEHFNWSIPTYVHVPILNSNMIIPDVQILDTYSNEICQALGTQCVSTELISFAGKLLKIIGDMRTVLTRSAGADMQLVLHMLDSIGENLGALRRVDYDTFIATQREKLKEPEIFFKDAFDQGAQRLKPIYEKICGYDLSSVNIENMIQKYRWGIWGEFRQTPRLDCFCATAEDKRWIVDWAKSNHILFWIKENLSGDKITEDLQKIAGTTKIDIASFWPPQFAEMAADEGWRKDNLDKIKAPVFVKNLGGRKYLYLCGKRSGKTGRKSCGGVLQKIINVCVLNKTSQKCRVSSITFSAKKSDTFDKTMQIFNKLDAYGCNISALGERSVRIREVEGSNPFRSTK